MRVTTLTSRPLAPSIAERRRRGPAHTFVLRGNVEFISLLDVIQWVCSIRQSWSIRILRRGVDAFVTIVDGDLVDAHWGGKVGHDALVAILEIRDGYFELQRIAQTPQRNLHGNWMSTLLLATKAADERSLPACDAKRLEKRRSVVKEGSTGGVVQTKARDSRSAVPHHLIDDGFAAVRSGDLEKAKAIWREALQHDPDNRALQFNLRKLENVPAHRK